MTVKQKWLEALRSGRYQQGKYSLKQKTPGEDTFCCLGVLCDVIDNKKWESSTSLYIFDHSSYEAMAPREYLESGFQRRLSEMNDHGYSFCDIANYIEANCDDDLNPKNLVP